MKKVLIALSIMLFFSILGMGLTRSTFTDSAEVLGSTFSVGSADIKLLRDVSGGLGGDNLADQIDGPSFEKVGPNWLDTYLVKVFNNTDSAMLLASNAEYETANDPEELRQLIFVEPFVWDDSDNNGEFTSDEKGESLGKKSIVKWKTEGYDLGELSSGEVKSYILEFSTDNVADSKQGASAMFDFEFTALGM